MQYKYIRVYDAEDNGSQEDLIVGQTFANLEAYDWAHGV